MIKKKVGQGYYCTICKKTYSHFTNIPEECMNNHKEGE